MAPPVMPVMVTSRVDIGLNPAGARAVSIVPVAVALGRVGRQARLAGIPGDAQP